MRGHLVDDRPEDVDAPGRLEYLYRFLQVRPYPARARVCKGLAWIAGGRGGWGGGGVPALQRGEGAIRLQNEPIVMWVIAASQCSPVFFLNP